LGTRIGEKGRLLGCLPCPSSALIGISGDQWPFVFLPLSARIFLSPRLRRRRWAAARRSVPATGEKDHGSHRGSRMGWKAFRSGWRIRGSHQAAWRRSHAEAWTPRAAGVICRPGWLPRRRRLE
jgi:hypothetical protein